MNNETMLSLNDYNHIKLLYEKFLKLNKYIESLIKNNEWDSISFALKDKDNLIKQILIFEKTRLEAIKSNEELYKLKLELIELEKKNIETVKKNKEILAKEIIQAGKTKKLYSAYEPSVDRTISTFDVSDEDE